MLRIQRIAFVLLALSTFAGSALAGPADDLAQGLRDFQAGKFEKAVTHLEASMKGKPSAKAALYLGNAHLKLGQLDQAKEAFETVLKLEPNHPKKSSIETLIRSIDARAETKLHIESTPPGAQVFIDNEATGPRGVTPLDLDVTVGPHRIVVKFDGYDTETRELVFKQGTPVDLKLPLTPKGCEVAISVKNPDVSAGVSVDGRDIVALPAKVMVRAGEHKLRVIAKGFDPKDETVTCDGFKSVAVASTLAKETGRLTVANAPGTIVKIDGKVVTLSQEDAERGIGLSPGQHEVSISPPDAPTRTSIITVRAGEAISVGADNEGGQGGFPSRALYLEAVGGANIVLRDWRLGANSFKAQNGQSRLSPGTSGMGGVRVGFHISRRFALETEVQWVGLPNELDFSHGLSYAANVLFHILPTRVTPFVALGGGAYQLISGQLGADLRPRGHLGLGVRGRATKWLSLRAEARDVISTGFESGGANNLELLGGVEFFIF